MPRILAGFLLPLLLTSCASVPDGPSRPRAETDAAWSARSAALQEMQAWDFNGRISVSGPDGSWNARIRWNQRGDAYDIDFMSLFGQRVARLQSNGADVALQLPNEEPLRAATAGELLAESFGWSAPVDALRYWVLGVPQPQHEATTRLDQHGRLSRLEQEGWRVEYPQYVGVGGAAGDLPRKLTLEGEPLSIRLVIDDWYLAE
ncbi:MAG: lipoprotein insertase outer membrane protein LolB [Gammaproteobacteria bacterium]